MRQIGCIILVTVFFLVSIPFTGFSAEKLNFVDETDKWEQLKVTIGDDKGWKKVEDKNGVKIYTRMTTVSPIKAFKGVADVKADFNTMIAFLADGNSYPSYVYLCNKAKILQQKDDSDLYLHSINKPPWPVKKRDTVSHTLWYYFPEKNMAYMDAIAVPKLIEKKKGHVRVPLVFIRVVVTDLKNGNVRISFEGVCEPGGLIPDWVANFCIKQTPRATLRNIIEKRPFEKYKGKKVSFMKTTSKKK